MIRPPTDDGKHMNVPQDMVLNMHLAGHVSGFMPVSFLFSKSASDMAVALGAKARERGDLNDHGPGTNRRVRR